MPTRGVAQFRTLSAMLFGMVVAASDLGMAAESAMVADSGKLFRSERMIDGQQPGLLGHNGQIEEVWTLSEAVAFALANNPRLRAALAAVERRAGESEAAFSPFLPRVDMLNRYVATSENLGPGAPGPTGGIVPNLQGTNSAWQSELQVQWMLFDFGRRASRLGQSMLAERVARMLADRARDTVALDVTAAYLAVLEADARRTIANESIRRAESVLRDTKARREAGVSLREEVLRGQVRLAEAEDQRIRAEEEGVAARARLNHALGRDAHLPIHVIPLAEPIHASENPVPDLEACLDNAAYRRQEIAAAREHVAIARFGRQGALAEFQPRVSSRGSLGYVAGDNVFTGWQEGVGLHIDIPLYAGGQRRGHLRTASAEVREAIADAQRVLNEVSLDVTLAHRRVLSAHERVQRAHPAVDHGRELVRVVQDRYRNGDATPTDMVDAETALVRAEQRLVSARIDHWQALAHLAYAMGELPNTFASEFQTNERESATLPPLRPAGFPSADGNSANPTEQAAATERTKATERTEPMERASAKTLGEPNPVSHFPERARVFKLGHWPARPGRR